MVFLREVGNGRLSASLFYVNNHKNVAAERATVRLSSSDSRPDTSSAIIPAKIPHMPAGNRGIVVMRPVVENRMNIRSDEQQNAAEPSMDLPRMGRFPQRLPISAAKVSPIIIIEKPAAAISAGKRSEQSAAAAST